MSTIMKEWQQEQDRRLMQFKTHEDYLDSLVADQDLIYLRGAEPRILAQLGYRSELVSYTRKTRGLQRGGWSGFHSFEVISTVLGFVKCWFQDENRHPATPNRLPWWGAHELGSSLT